MAGSPNHGNWLQGKYVLKNPNKYVVNTKFIHYKSSFERKMFKYFDETKSVVSWGYEIVSVPYMFNGGNHNYFIDIYAEIMNKKGTVDRYLIEIKPKKQVTPPKNSPRRNQANFRKEMAVYQQNSAKWRYAEAYANNNNMKFKILTEEQIF